MLHCGRFSCYVSKFIFIGLIFCFIVKVKSRSTIYNSFRFAETRTYEQIPVLEAKTKQTKDSVEPPYLNAAVEGRSHTYVNDVAATSHRNENSFVNS